jgi:hypothetical protein
MQTSLAEEVLQHLQTVSESLDVLTQFARRGDDVSALAQRLKAEAMAGMTLQGVLLDSLRPEPNEASERSSQVVDLQQRRSA